MEITNLSKTSRIVLPVGARIGQIVFMRTGDISHVYHGKYQKDADSAKTESLEEIVNQLRDEWTPYSMIPKLYKDNE